MKYKCDTDCSDIEVDRGIFICENSSSKSIQIILDNKSYDTEEDLRYLNENKTKSHVTKRKNNLELKIDSTKLPCVFFVVSLIIISNACLNYTPNIIKLSNNSNLFSQRFRIFHFSYYISNLSALMKCVIIASIMLLTTICYTLYSLIRQRISVPELKYLKFNNLLFISFSMSLVPILLMTTFYYKEFDLFSKFKIKIYDNILNFVFMIFSCLMCYFSKKLLDKFSSKEYAFYSQLSVKTKNALLILLGSVSVLCKVNLFIIYI